MPWLMRSSCRLGSLQQGLRWPCSPKTPLSCWRALPDPPTPGDTDMSQQCPCPTPAHEEEEEEEGMRRRSAVAGEGLNHA